jgi:hypothetical protein
MWQRSPKDVRISAMHQAKDIDARHQVTKTIKNVATKCTIALIFLPP